MLQLVLNMDRRRLQRAATVAGFYLAVASLGFLLIAQSINLGSSQLSAYDGGWDDLSTLRDDLNEMGIETRSLVSSPLVLNELDDARNTTLIISGVERNALALPQFDDSGFISFSGSDGYSSSEVDAIRAFVQNGGTVLLLEDYGFASTLAGAFGVEITDRQTFDRVYASELDRDFVWTCLQSTPCGYDELNATIDPTSLSTHPRWGGSSEDALQHPCAAFDGVRYTDVAEAGICRHHVGSDGFLRYNASYRILLNNATSLELIEDSDAQLETSSILSTSSSQATVDVNADGEIWVGTEQTEETPDLMGKFNFSMELCTEASCDPDRGGRVVVVSDGSVFMNALYDPEGYRVGAYTDGEIPQLAPPDNDNRKWVLDLVAEALVAEEGSLEPSPTATVIFEESRHTQQPAVLVEMYNMVYYLLVYFTSESLAMVLLFIGLFVAFEAVLLRKEDPENWRHVFSIIYYGFGDAGRYSYYGEPQKIRQVFLSKVRNSSGLTREEFDALTPEQLSALIADPVLLNFVYERKTTYPVEHLVGYVKRIKTWGRT